ncbi:hypothetical protein JJL45_10235 [Tamlana sp. s12]|uniref:substrate import-associated zinc metallohydrolase lipoprotein n=1 Tax=Tamlana sp. s12 TaxID=1630406 RepID=UPI0009ED304E|nr:substrate import-associated zinc metallohydrolase lipoprotein [Tamlana sp. s12]QQY81307.1 hypothetical protein JJL45_10235 [Tamlana sp. s12]
MKNTIKLIGLMFSATLFMQCSSDDTNTTYTPPEDPSITHPNDVYLYDNDGHSLFERYGTATRWRWNDNFISASQSATPIESDLVIDATKIIDYLWIEPYTEVGDDGENFIKELFPPELVYIGSYIYKDDGTRLLGYAEGGARITLLNMNSLDLQNGDWLANPSGGILATAHHEFSHIIHQTYGIPIGYNTISDTYLGNGWSNGVSLADAIKLGMVSPYSTLNEFEDFCEVIAHYLVLEDDIFNYYFLDQEDCSVYTDGAVVLECQEINQGRLKIRQKLDLILAYFKNNFNIDLVAVKATLQTRLTEVINTGVIPE